MGKTGKWLRNFLTGKKDKGNKIASHSTSQVLANNTNIGNELYPSTPVSTPAQLTTPKDKRRWSFRRSSAAATGRQDAGYVDYVATATPPMMDHAHIVESDAKKHALAVAVATAAAADAAVAAAKAAAAVFQLTDAAVAPGRDTAVEEAAATKIQAVFRAHLARKALNALKGLVKLQALVRGHLVRKQATVTFRCMQALVTVQARARAQRLLMVEDTNSAAQRQSVHRKSTNDSKYRNMNQDFDRGVEENIKIVEMDLGDYYKPVLKSRRNSYSNHTEFDKAEHKNSTSIKQEYRHISPSPSARTDMSPRTCSNHFEEYSIRTALSSPQCYSGLSKPKPDGLPLSYPRSEYDESLYSEYPFYPSYMANTESSRAKVRSHSAPKQRPVETFERQPSRRRPSVEGRNIPRAVRMQRSSSHVGSTAQNYQYPGSVKLDRSSVSLKDSECGSTCTVQSNVNYCRSLVGFDVQGARN